jgi:hypothetical protein
VTSGSTKTHAAAGRNGAGAMTTLRRAVIRHFRLAGLQSIRAGMQAVMPDIRAVLAMTTRQLELMTS